MNSSYCNYVETTGLADHYAVASCTCPDVLDGIYRLNIDSIKLFLDLFLRRIL